MIHLLVHSLTNSLHKNLLRQINLTATGENWVDPFEEIKIDLETLAFSHTI